jgi:hypothetical protein
VDKEPWRNLDPEVAGVIEPVLPAVSEQILEAIGKEIPEYSMPLEGAFGRGVYRGVGEALRQFVALIRDPDGDRGPSREVYIALGRGEFENGRSLDSLQAAYRIGARIAWRLIAGAGLDHGLDARTLSLLAESIFVYIDELSADTTEGYAAAQSERLGERLRRERQLVAALLRTPPTPPAELASLGRASGWRIPLTASTVSCQERDLAEITRFLPIDVISATVDGLGCLVFPDPDGPGRIRQLEQTLAERGAALGPAAAPEGLAASWRLARSAQRAIADGAIGAEGLVHVDQHLVELALYESRDLIARLRDERLAPLQTLTPKARSRMALTTAAWLEHRGNAAEMARELRIHPQTARYRVARLRELFGDGLDDPEVRFELELSLRGLERGYSGTVKP